MASVPLRLEAENGSEIEEYRVDNGKVEVRTLRSFGLSGLHEVSWRQLTSQHLRSHVERNTVVAQWLERRLGWRRLLQACVGQEPPEARAEEYVERNAA